MHSPMMRMKSATIGQPHAMAAGPPLFQPRPNEVKQPARIEMIENEMAKLQNPDQDRCQFLGVAQFGEMSFVLVQFELFVTLWHGNSPSAVSQEPDGGQAARMSLTARDNRASKVCCPTFGGERRVNR